MPLADRHTKVWAMIEERLLKYLCALAARIEQLRPANPIHIVPWVDVYYQLSSSGETVTEPLLKTRQPVTLPRWRFAS